MRYAKANGELPANEHARQTRSRESSLGGDSQRAVISYFRDEKESTKVSSLKRSENRQHGA